MISLFRNLYISKDRIYMEHNSAIIKRLDKIEKYLVRIIEELEDTSLTKEEIELLKKTEEDLKKGNFEDYIDADELE